MSSPTAAAAAAAPPIADMAHASVSVTSTAAVAAVVVVADMLSSSSSEAGGASALLPQPTPVPEPTQAQTQRLSCGTPLEEIPLDTTFTGPALQAVPAVHAPMQDILASSPAEPKLKVDISTASGSYVSATAAGEEQASTPSSTADGARRSHSLKSDGVSASSSVSVGTGAGSQREGGDGSSSTSAAHSSLSEGLRRAASGKSTAADVRETSALAQAEARPALEKLLSIHKAAHGVPLGERQLVRPEAVHAE